MKTTLKITDKEAVTIVKALNALQANQKTCTAWFAIAETVKDLVFEKVSNERLQAAGDGIRATPDLC